jgi:ribulose-phosphate 3-epimerase
MDNLGQSIKELEDSGIDRFHLDIMDGVFVPNYSLGLQDVEAVCRLSAKKAEIHLMTVNPGKYVRKFADLGVKIIYIHPESDYHPSTVIQLIIEAGAEPGIVLSPGTSVDSVKDLLRISRYVLIMTVNPGQAGQPFLPYVDEKIRQLIKLKKEYGFELGLDGACSARMIDQYFPLGVDSFVLGTMALFHKKAPYIETMNNLRSITNGTFVMADQKPIKFFITDVDGTLTDGKIYIGENEEMMKAFDIKDGYAIHELLPEYGIKPIFITGRESKIVENRASELGVTLVFQNIKDKLSQLKKIADENSITLEEIAYIGDDISDLDCIKACGISGCPADAPEEIKQYTDFISKKPCGSGAVRDFVEWIISRGR